MRSTGLESRCPTPYRPASHHATSRVSTNWRYASASVMEATSTVKISSSFYHLDYQSRSIQASLRPKLFWKLVSMQRSPELLPRHPTRPLVLILQRRQRMEALMVPMPSLDSQYNPSMLLRMTMPHRATRTRLDRIFLRSMGTEAVTSLLLCPKARQDFPMRRDDEKSCYRGARFDRLYLSDRVLLVVVKLFT